nr:glycosyltransferase family 2 protein [Aliikangiella sp. G2MR2-5]
MLVPVYNHARLFSSVVKKMQSLGLPIIVVNDGSDDENSRILQQLASEIENVDLVALEENQGKGGAVTEGIRHAFHRGYSHAFQVDADGQHNLEDIESFVECSRAHPDAIICGHPVYDSSVPLGRLIPRYITHFWVWVETLSFSIIDSMCGFRLYPVKPAFDLIESEYLGKRMDFDTEILVRSYWRQVPIVFKPTRVIYPEDGISHFNLLNDNWLITKMHTRLFFGMLLRLPQLLKRKFFKKMSLEKNTKAEQHWSLKSEKGAVWGIKFLVNTYRILGKRAFYLLLHPIITYFVLTSPRVRGASRQFWNNFYQYQGINKKIGIKIIYRHVYAFGCAAIDKIACWLGDIKQDSIEFESRYLIEKIATSGKGAVFIGSHLGNLEVCRAIGETAEEIKINAVVFNQHATKFNSVLNQANEKVSVNIIQAQTMGAETAILLEEKVSAGEVVIIVGDRTSTSTYGRVRYARFLGHKAPFAEGPYILAGLLDCPVYLMFCLKQSGKYHIYLEHFADSLKFPRRFRDEKLAQTIERYAERLEHYCIKAPEQWFNFFNFWQADNPENVIRPKMNTNE